MRAQHTALLAPHGPHEDATHRGTLAPHGPHEEHHIRMRDTISHHPRAARAHAYPSTLALPAHTHTPPRPARAAPHPILHTPARPTPRSALHRHRPLRCCRLYRAASPLQLHWPLPRLPAPPPTPQLSSPLAPTTRSCFRPRFRPRPHALTRVLSCEHTPANSTRAHPRPHAHTIA
jgi:hypothetical protein